MVICMEGPVIRHKTVVIVWKLDGSTAYRPIDSKYFIEPIEKIADALVNNNVSVDLAWSVVHPTRIDYWAMLAGQIPDEIRKLEPYTAGRVFTNADIPIKDLLPDKASQPLPKTP